MHPRHSRRTLRFAIGALLLAPVLSSCGFDYATDRVNDLTAGHTNRDASVDVINSLIVAGQPDSGTLVGMLVNNDVDTDAELTSVASGPDDTAADVDELTIPAGGRAELRDAGIRIEGTFEAGEYYDVTLTFDNGDEVELSLPVVTECGQYDGYDDAPADGADSGESYSCETEEAPEQSH
jgi:copper(I)-binding protein